MKTNSRRDPLNPFGDLSRKVIMLGVLVILLNFALLAGAIAIFVVVLRALNVIG